jgi:putative SOS response-associated peptidase YedK
VAAQERHQAVLLHPHGRGTPFAFAGLWESWGKGGEGEVRTCTIRTTGTNALLGEIHYRMPVFLAPDVHDVWLDPASKRDEFTGLLAPYPEDEMEAYPVSRFVNSPSNNDPSCIEPAA